MVVSSTGESLSHNPGKILPDSVLFTGHLDHIEVSDSLDFGLDSVSLSSSSEFKALSNGNEGVDETGGLSVEDALEALVVVGEANLFSSNDSSCDLNGGKGHVVEGFEGIDSVNSDVA